MNFHVVLAAVFNHCALNLYLLLRNHVYVINVTSLFVRLHFVCITNSIESYHYCNSKQRRNLPRITCISCIKTPHFMNGHSRNPSLYIYPPGVTASTYYIYLGTKIKEDNIHIA